MKRKVTSLTKFSKHQELKVLLKKEKKIDTDSSDFSDDISEDDNDADLDYVAETPQTKCKTSFLKKKTPSKITPTAFPKSKSPLTQKKTPSKIRPTPFPRSKSPLTQKKKEKPKIKRKAEIERNLKEIFGTAESVEKVPYSGRLRLKCPCPVKKCEFRTVDMTKHLKYKHQWTEKLIKLQTNYFHTMFDAITRMKTYDLHKPNICFKCYTFFDRLDNHLAHKHFQRGTQEFRDTLQSYYNKSKAILTAEDTFSHHHVHNVQVLFDKIEKFNSGDNEEEPSEGQTQPTAPIDQPTMEPTAATDQPTQKAAKNKPKTSSSNEHDKPGPYGYQKRQRGKYVEQKKGKQVPLLKHKIEITAAFRKQYKLHNKLEFRYYYDDTTKLLNDFKTYREYHYQPNTHY